jgi:hypothetical protein
MEKERIMNEKELAHQARLARCAEIIAAIRVVPSDEEIEKIKSAIAAHAAFVHKLESIVNMWPKHPDVVELVNLRDKITARLEVVSEVLGLPTTA